MLQSPFSEKYYNLPVQDVARSLLGARLVRILQNQRLSGTILETEAYDGESDLACHARAGRTARTAVMYGKPGRAYVYFIYGMHWMLNCVTGEEGHPAAVLIRALLPDEGQTELFPLTGVINGPGRICRALAIDRQFNGTDLTQTHGLLWIEPGVSLPNESVEIGPRVGIQNVPEPWRSKAWRYKVIDPQTLALPG